MFFTSSQARESARANRRLAAQAQAFRDTQDTWYDGTVASVDRRIASCQRILHAAQSALGHSPFDIEPLQILGELQDDHRALTGLRHDLHTGYADRVAGKHDDPWGEFGTHYVEETDLADPPEIERIHTPGYGDRTIVKRVPKEGAIWKPKEEQEADKRAREEERRQNGLRLQRGLQKAYGPKAAAIDDDERRWATLEAPRFVRANLDASFHRDELATRANHWAARVTSGFAHPAETRRLFVSAVLDEAQELPRPQLRPRLGNRRIVDIEPEAMFL